MRKLFLAAAALAFAAPAVADVTKLDVPADKTWQHVWTSVRMPPKLDGFERDWIADYGDKETDIIGTYQDYGTKTTASLYIYRAGNVNVSMWQDRVLTVMSNNSQLGKFDAAARMATVFTPAQGGGENSGYRFVGPMPGQRIVSSGSAMFAHDGWLIAVRMSSGTLDPAALDKRLESFVAAVPMPAAKISYPPAGPITPCADMLEFKKDAKRAKPDLGSMLVMGTFMSAARKDEKDKPVTEVAPVNLCRDREASLNYSVYRVDGDHDAYTLALADAGISVWVAKNDVASLLGGSGADYWATMTDTNLSSSYAPFKKLPPPEQVFKVVQSEGPVTTTSVDENGDSTINLQTP